MKLAKKLETEILELYHTYWDAYLKGDMKTFASFLDDNLVTYGTAASEIFNSKKEAVRFYKTTADQMTGKADFRKRKISAKAVGDTVVINEQSDLHILIDGAWAFYGHARITAIFQQTGGAWKLVHQHASFPDSRTEEGEQIAAQKIKKENLQLREAVKRRTVELEGKNRELEIETALEKVRSIAMSMKERVDMLKICKTISLQLAKLGVRETRNVQTAIFNVPKGTYMNYEYYAKHDKTFITETAYTNHKVARAFAIKMLKGKGEVSITYIKGREKVKEWLNYQKGTNVFIDTYLNTATSLTYYWYSLGPVALGISAYTPLTKDEQGLFSRFLKVFELAYRRYLDIEKAEAQAREAQIEASLEKVRAQALGMRKPEELTNICEVLFKELKQLGFAELRNSMINIHDDGKKTFVNYDYSDEIGKSITPLYYDIHPVIKKQIKQIRSADDAFSETVFKGKDLESWKAFRKSRGEKEDNRIINSTALHYYFYSIGTGSIGISTFHAIGEEKLELLKRFRNVFAFAYRRYMDVAQAEAQIREAEIELALERVRARTMAMQHSEELSETVMVMFEQFKALGEEPERMAIEIVNEKEHVFDIWATQHGGSQLNLLVQISLDEPHVMQKMYKAWKAKTRSITIDLQGNELEEYFKFLKKAGLPVLRKIFGKRRVQNVATFSKGILTIITPEPRPQETIQLLERFAAVFDGTYTRFLDLQKAEAQAREAQIQLALERVRARTMAMQQSDELPEAAALLFQQIQSLGMPAWSAGYCTWNEDKSAVTLWMSSEGVLQPPFTAPTTKDELFIQMRKGLEQGKTLHVVEMGGKKLVKHYQYMRTLPVVGEILDSIVAAGHPLPAFQIMHHAYFPKGFLLFITYEPVPDAHDIFKRFGKVFDQTYTRFLDLQKAEAQAREAQIEAALERVRSRSMAMHKSEELADLSLELVKQVQTLGVATWFCAFNIYDDDLKGSLEWGSNGQGTFPKYRTPREGIFLRYYKAGQRGETLLINEIGEKECPAHYDYLCTLPGVGEQLLKMKAAGISFPTSQIDHVAYFKYGYIIFITYEPVPESHDIFLRFAKVFEQTYTRFLDLQKAEAQARQAKIEAAMEKVRSRAMTMQKPNELVEVAELLRKEMGLLGVEELETSSIYIHQEHTGKTECWYAIKDVQHPEKELVSDHMTINLKETGIGRKMLRFYQSAERQISISMQGDARREWINYCADHSKVLVGFYGNNIPDRTYHLYKFTNGYMGAASPGEISAESWDLLQRATSVFSLAYTRFSDLQQAEAQAREAQIETALERVRSRTMGMQKSEELKEIIIVVSEQLQKLGFKFSNVSFITHNVNYDLKFWMSAPGVKEPILLQVPYLNNPAINHFKQMVENDIWFSTDILTADESLEWNQHVIKTTWLKDAPKETKNYLLRHTPLAKTNIRNKNIAFAIGNYAGIPYSDEENEVFKRFANVFEQSYTRFLDLQKAEAQAREAQIEAALERVRSRSLAMHHSSELSAVVDTLLREFTNLEFTLTFCIINLIDEQDMSNTVWAANPETGKHPESYYMKFEDYPFHHAMWDAWKEQKKNFIYTIEGEEKKIYDEYLYTKTEFRRFPKHVQEANKALKRYVAGFTFFKYSGLQTVSENHISDNELEILERFGRVFEQSYTRFLDLQKAEAQTREAQIEAALERVRSRSMAMHKSDELLEAGEILFAEMQKLGIESLTAGYVLLDKEEKNGLNYTPDPSTKKIMPVPVIIPHNETIHMQQVVENWKKGNPFFMVEMDEKETIKHQTFIAERSTNFPLNAAQLIAISPARLFLHNFYFKEGYVLIVGGAKLSVEQTDIMLRFAKVFQQTYTRFLDLQKAEARAKEAKIETALERVRSRTMGMQKSEELKDIIKVVYEQFAYLKIPVEHAGFIIDYKEKDDMLIWLADQHEVPSQITIPYFDSPHWNSFRQAKEKKLEFFVNHLSFEEKNKFYNDLFKLFPVPGEAKKYYFSCPGLAISTVLLENVGLYIENFAGNPYTDEENATLMRFGKVFQQTYTRFLDLQKAEAQAREAKIEAALERVRSRTLAMHKSDELAETSAVMFKQLIELGIAPNRLYINIVKDINGEAEFWITDEDGSKVSMAYTANMNDNTSFKKMFEGWKHKEHSLIIDMQGEELKDYFQHLTHLGVPFKGGLEQKRRVQHLAYFGNGFIGMASPDEQPQETIQLLERFAAVFNLTYTRFNDLQVAEAQAREAVIEASLERMRSVAMSIRKSEELIQVAESLYNELRGLGISNIRNAQIVIKMTGDEMYLVCVYSDDTSEVFRESRYDTPPITKQMYDELERSSEALYQRELGGKEFEQWLKWREDTGAKINSRLLEARSVSFCLYSIGEGHLGISAYNNITAEQLNVLKRFRNVFELSYRRFMDVAKSEEQALKLQQEKDRLELTLSELQATQKQLIQSEKMASLGELTAGIAHEIQNPLNFVNNFSEVSNELLEEMLEEVEKGNYEEAKTIADDVRQNLEKINHHGKRADGIVKGMLQHSRSSSGQKELTDINALADEYLRLAYHGLRAKDKSFNAKFETRFDETVGKINVMSQDIGRVILNLINNAFYAVSEKKILRHFDGLSAQGDSYEPTVTVSTQRNGDWVLVSVKDNGNGIPQKVLDKIFQPFFTTKPTGQGTGLGLSLSYDIVKAHGGEIKVTTQENTGTEFIIQLPYVS
ncbi:MAG: nuclear transport factor 2 family protein [Chitinophagaceae bacterium]|nr:nuclear transport factor 2 family protein [Chitinophagaceae bacterium]